MKKTIYKTNTEPKIGDKVRLSRHIEEGVDALYTVEAVGGGRLGNKVTIRKNDPDYCQTYYYYCLCPQ